MDNNTEPFDDEYEDDEEDDESEDEIEPRPLLTEIISIWISAVSLIFRPKPITFEEEIEFASWRRFWVTIISGALVTTIFSTISALSINNTLRLPRQSPNVAFDFLWAVLIGLVIFGFLIWMGSYISYRWIVRQKIETESNFLEHSQIVAIVWLAKQILLIVSSIISLALTNFTISQTLGRPASQDIIDKSIIVGVIIGLLVSGIIIIYSYWILALGLKTNHIGLREKQLWIVIGILFLALEPLRILISTVLPKIPLIIWLRDELQNRFISQT